MTPDSGRLARLRVGLILGTPAHATRVLLALTALQVAALPPASAIVCTAPGSHGSLWQAIADTACTEIQLADQIFRESVTIARSLALVGAPGGLSTIRGSIAISGAVTVGLTDLVVTGCADARVTATGGAGVTGSGLVVTNSTSPACPFLFADGFESADTSVWSSSLP